MWSEETPLAEVWDGRFIKGPSSLIQIITRREQGPCYVVCSAIASKKTRSDNNQIQQLIVSTKVTMSSNIYRQFGLTFVMLISYLTLFSSFQH